MSHLSKEDRLAKQLMLPRMNKNSKKIIVQKKKMGGPVFQKYDVKQGITNIEKKTDSPQKLVPVKPITPGGMRHKQKSMRNNAMMKMFYSKKELVENKKKGKYGTKKERSERGNEDLSKEEMMYRILKNKSKKQEKEEEDDIYETQEDSSDEKMQYEKYQNKYYQDEEKMYETPVQNQKMMIKPMMHKSNSMLPKKNDFVDKHSRYNKRESEVDLMHMDSEEKDTNSYLQAFRKNQRGNISAYYGQDIRNSSRDKSKEKKSTSMKPKKELYDPFKDFTMRQKKYDKSLLREMLELENMFTENYSKHIDSMVGLVKQDIAIQSSIQEEKGPMKFEQQISDVKKVLRKKKDSLDKIFSAICKFEAKFHQLKKRKQEAQRTPKEDNSSISYTRKGNAQDHGLMRPMGNMQGELMTSKSMYGLGGSPGNLRKPSNQEYQYKGFGNSRSGRKKDIIETRNMYEGGGQKLDVHKRSYMQGSNKELRPIASQRANQKFSMMPNMKIGKAGKDLYLEKMRNRGYKEKEERGRTDTETTKDLMKDLDNDISLI